MFANTFQSGFISILYSVGSSPLAIWDKQVKNGHIRRIVDEDVKSLVLEISGTNVATTYITCPIKPRASLGIRLPFLVMIIKNMKKYFSFEVQILDDKDMHRRFRVSNFQSTTKVRPFCTTMPIGLSNGWNQVQFNLADFTKRAYGSTYLETTRVQIHANIRIRRIYFSDMLYTDDEIPNEFKLFLPVAATRKGKAELKKDEKKEKVSSKEEMSEGEMEFQFESAEEELLSGAMPTPVKGQEIKEQPAQKIEPEEKSMGKEEAAEEQRMSFVEEERTYIVGEEASEYGGAPLEEARIVQEEEVQQAQQTEEAEAEQVTEPSPPNTEQVIAEEALVGEEQTVLSPEESPTVT